jgi:hypothetical protein
MQVAVPSPRLAIYLSQHKRIRLVACCGLLTLVSVPVAAHAADNLILVDTQMIAALQLRAQQASPREQVQLYADLADKISLLVTRQLAEGNEDQAQATLHQLEACTAEIESDLQRDSKGLKKTELLLHNTNRRLADLMRSASGDMKPIVQSALRRLDRAQTTLLGAVFEK